MDELDFANGDTYGRFIQPNTPGIFTPPRSQTIAFNANVTFFVDATGPPPLSYQWQRNGVNISGAIDSVLQLNNVSFADVGFYRVVVSNSFGAVTSELATLFALPRPSIVQQPQSRLSVNAGDSVTFNVVASGGPPLAYQWRFERNQHSGRNRGDTDRARGESVRKEAIQSLSPIRSARRNSA
jgi:hypothetical protein